MNLKNLFFHTYVIWSVMLCCCIDFAISKIAYKKPIRIKEKCYSKLKKDSSFDKQITDSTITFMSKEDQDLMATTPYSRDTSPVSNTNSFETSSKEESNTTEDLKTTISLPRDDTSCHCGIFLGSQFVKGSSEQPKGEPAISTTLERSFACSAIGQKQCQTKCLEKIVQYLPSSGDILCASLDRDIRKEKAYLFVRNCNTKWYNTNLSSGREYCCKNGIPYRCPKK